MIYIERYKNELHRQEVITLWNDIFGYGEERNSPGLSIDNKVAAKDGLFFVALENGKVTGTIMAGYDGHRGWIYSLAVRKDKRNRNLGTKLLQHAEDKLKELGCCKIKLQILPENEQVIDFYTKNGYKIEKLINMGKQIDENILKNKQETKS